MPEKFKLTPEMIAELEEKINRDLDYFNNGAKERLNELPDYSFFAAAWVIIDIRTGKVQVIDPVKNYGETDECDGCCELCRAEEYDWCTKPEKYDISGLI